MGNDSLTDLKIKKLRPSKTGRIEIPDGKFPGLSIRVSKTGVKTFTLRTRIQGEQIRLSLGHYPYISLAEARARAYQAVADAKSGKTKESRQSKAQQEFQFKNIVDDYLRRYCERYMKERTFRETERVMNVEFVKIWKDRDLREIKKQDIVEAINKILERPQKDLKKRIIKSESPSAANHAFSTIRAFFNWCVGQGSLEHSPCVGLRSPAPKQKRDRVLDDRELALVWNTAKDMGYPYGDIIRLLIITVQRRSEVAGLRWDMLNLEERIWRVPADENKSGREYLVPLSDIALDIIEAIPRLDERLIFPAQRSNGKVFADWSKSKKRIDELSGVTDWTVHDLRRTGSTGLARMGVAPHVKERVLNHLTGELGGVAGVYDIYSYLPEKKAALDLWACHIEILTRK